MLSLHTIAELTCARSFPPSLSREIYNWVWECACALCVLKTNKKKKICKEKKWNEQKKNTIALNFSWHFFFLFLVISFFQGCCYYECFCCCCCHISHSPFFGHFVVKIILFGKKGSVETFFDCEMAQFLPLICIHLNFQKIISDIFLNTR